MVLHLPVALPFILLILPTHGLLFGGAVQNGLSVGRVSTQNGGNVTTLSEMGCGTWSWGNRLLFDYDTSQDEEIYEAYRYVRKSGVTVFDTADSYGTLDLNGRAEILLGQFERRYQQELVQENQAAGDISLPWWNLGGDTTNTLHAPEQQVQVATKFAPYPWRLTRQSFVTAAQESLNRLEQPTLAIAQAHWSTKNYLPQQESAIWGGLADCYYGGYAQSIGVSNYGPKQLRRVSQYMEERNVPLVTAQIQYSLMTYEVATQMNQACEETKCTLISYSPLCLGLLTGKYTLDSLPRQGNPRRQLFRELLAPGGGTQDLLNTIQAVAKDYDKTNSQIAINWALCKGTVPIPGCRTLQQAKENIGATGWKLSSDAVTELDKAAAAVQSVMIQNVFQTR